VLVGERFRLFRCVSQHPLALIAQRQIHGGGDFFPPHRHVFNLLADRLHWRLAVQKLVRGRLVLAQQAQQQVFRLDIRAAELAGFIPGKKNNAAGVFCISLKHRFFLEGRPACLPHAG
jgi:hypothetical protein